MKYVIIIGIKSLRDSSFVHKKIMTEVVFPK